jgi:acyl-CoA thioesterase I
MDMIKKIAVSLVVVALSVSCSINKSVKVACIGDSITEGAGIYWQSKFSYPVQLDSILGPEYSVLNCGRSGANMLKKSDLPYWICNEFYNVFAFEPDVIIIKLGTNDSKPQNWNEENYVKDFQSMIDTLKTIPTQPRIYVCLPVPAYNNAWGIRDSVIRAGVIPSIEKVAKANNLTIIDLYKALSNHAEFFPDSIHPNEAGAKVMAEVVAKAIKK